VLGRLLVLLVAMTVPAGAQRGQSLVLVSDDTAFDAALEDALVPAGLDIVTVGDISTPPSAELPATSRALADREHATAMVWLLPAPAGTTLVTYDRGVDRLLVRELPYRSPLTAPQAAEAARMVRTMLRALRVSTDSDQLSPTAPLEPEPYQPVIGASAGVGAWFLAPGANSALAASLAIAWRPHQLGAQLGVTLAPAAEVMSGAFAGEVRDIVVAAQVHKSFAVDPIRVVPSAGAALHAIHLEGSFGGGPLSSRRFDPAVRLGVTTVYDLAAGLEVGLAVSADCLLRRQRYEAESEEILVIPRVQVLAGVIVGIRR